MFLIDGYENPCVKLTPKKRRVSLVRDRNGLIPENPSNLYKNCQVCQ